MKIAILSLTVKGAQLAQKVKNDIEGTVVCYEKVGRHSGGEAQSYDKMGPLVETLFKEMDRILFIMSTGIVVRVIAPFIVHKSEDPAIVVMDEMGYHAISLLSGHLGGANEWALEIGQVCGATPVITTATDVNGLLAPDVLARKLHLKIDRFDDLVAINSAIVAGERVSYYIDEELFNSAEYVEACKNFGVEAQRVSLGTLSQKDDAFSVCITDRIISIPGRTLFLRPPTMILGIGCRRDTEKKLIIEAIKASLKEQNRSIKSVFGAASVIVKADEVGLLEAMKELRIAISFYKQEEMASLIEEEQIEESNFVKNTIGVGNVCETTSMLMGKTKELIQKKTIYPRTTVAIAKANWSLSELDQVMPMK